MKPGARSIGLDLLRVCCALGVVSGHLLAHLHEYVPISIQRVDRWNFVDCFFVLSGFVLARAYGPKVGSVEGFRSFLWARLARLYPLHAATTVALVLVGFLAATRGVQFRVAAGVDPHAAPSHLLLLQAWNTTTGPTLNSPTWSLSAEMFLLLLFPVLFSSVRRIPVAASIAAIVAFAAALHVWRSAAGLSPWTEATHDFGVLRAVPSFVAGIVVARMVDDFRGVRVSARIAALAAAIVLASIMMDAPQEITIASFPVLVFCVARADLRGWSETRSRHLVSALAELTYGMFILHTFVAIALLQALRWSGQTGATAVVATMTLGVLGSIGAAFVANRLFEAPARRWLRDLPAMARQSASEGTTAFGARGAPVHFASVASVAALAMTAVALGARSL
jgi:peptidoglycan/LPS O-acetylase OafA/YrhL